ncbi:hypothetical protein AMTRI_Chr02g215110 [Amborella trichopoda]
MRCLPLVVTFLIIWVVADSRKIIIPEDIGLSTSLGNIRSFDGFEIEGSSSRIEIPSLKEFPLEFICNACLEALRLAEKVLADPEFLENIKKCAGDICSLLPSNLQGECEESFKSYIEKAVVFLQEYLSGERLCNSTGLCPGYGETISNNERNIQLNFGSFYNKLSSMLRETLLEVANMAYQRQEQSEVLNEKNHSSTVLLRFNEKASGNISCDACHRAIDEMEKDLRNPVTKLKLIKILLQACEEVQDHVKECKKLVLEYVPLILVNLEKYLKNNDICAMLHVCKDHMILL